jgi:hypothetical protein
VKGAVGLLPMALIMVGLSPFAPKVAQRVGLRTILVAGALLVGTGLLVMAQMVDTTSYWSIVPGLAITALGLAATMTPATTAITGSLSRGHQGVASALNDTAREIGGALGIALLGSIFNSQYSANVHDVAATLNPAQGTQVEEGISGAMRVAEGMGSSGAPVLTAARQALVDAWIGSMWVGAAIAVVAAGLVLALSLGKKGRRDMSAAGVLGELDTETETASETEIDGVTGADGARRQPALASDAA